MRVAKSGGSIVRHSRSKSYLLFLPATWPWATDSTSAPQLTLCKMGLNNNTNPTEWFKD